MLNRSFEENTRFSSSKRSHSTVIAFFFNIIFSFRPFELLAFSDGNHAIKLAPFSHIHKVRETNIARSATLQFSNCMFVAVSNDARLAKWCTRMLPTVSFSKHELNFWKLFFSFLLAVNCFVLCWHKTATNLKLYFLLISTKLSVLCHQELNTCRKSAQHDTSENKINFVGI